MYCPYNLEAFIRSTDFEVNERLHRRESASNCSVGCSTQPTATTCASPTAATAANKADARLIAGINAETVVGDRNAAIECDQCVAAAPFFEGSCSATFDGSCSGTFDTSCSGTFVPIEVSRSGPDHVVCSTASAATIDELRSSAGAEHYRDERHEALDGN